MNFKDLGGVEKLVQNLAVSMEDRVDAVEQEIVQVQGLLEGITTSLEKYNRHRVRAQLTKLTKDKKAVSTTRKNNGKNTRVVMALCRKNLHPNHRSHQHQVYRRGIPEWR